MDHYEKALALLLEAVKKNTGAATNGTSQNNIPVGVSNRHIHLSQRDLDALFGSGYELTKIKDLSQPGQFACKETLTLVGPKGAIEKVRILGPLRKETQVEILLGDSFKLGVKGVIKMSGELLGTPGATLVGPAGSVQLTQGVIVAQRHIHMSLADAERFGVHDGDIVRLQVSGTRGGIYDNVAIRANNSSALDCHLDMEEANAMQINDKTTVQIVK